MVQRTNLKWTRLHQFLHDKYGVRYFVTSLGILLVTGSALLVWMWQQPVADVSTSYASATPMPRPAQYISPLTGAVLSDESATKRAVTAIIIENSPAARPQSGLKDAGIIYEAIAEGGITRFIAFYQESRPALIGPVRSVRPYFVEWAATYDASIAHIGGSAKALQMVRSGSYGTDIDQFFNAGSYWRASDRAAPHNVYTNFDRLDALNAAKGKTASSFSPLPRKNDDKPKTVDASQIYLPISSKSYNVDYTYDAASNSYLRSVGGEPHLDREAGRLQPKVVIALQTVMTKQFEDGYREQIITVGSGRAFIFQDGTVTEATWSRPDVKSQLSFTDASGKALQLNRGQTWITALPGSKVPSWQ